MSQSVQGNVRTDDYVGYLNNVDLFIDAMYDERKNPNGIGKLKICFDGSSILNKIINNGIPVLNWFSGGAGASALKDGVGQIYNEIFNSTENEPYFEKKNNSKALTIKFIVNDDIAFGGGNKWEDSIQKLIDGQYGRSTKEFLKNKFGGKMTGKAGSPLERAAELAPVIKEMFQGASAIGGMQFKTLMQTIQFWNGSEGPKAFKLKFNLLATNPRMDIRKALLALYATVYPLYLTDAYNDLATRTIGFLKTAASQLLSGSPLEALKTVYHSATGSSNLIASGMLCAPLGYNPVDGYMSSMYPTTKEESGLLDLRIGKWLHVPNLLAQDFHAIISKVTTRWGFPLYAKCEMTLIPVRMWTLADVYDTFFSSTVNNEDESGLGKTAWAQAGGAKTRVKGVLDKGEITRVRVGEMP